MDRNILQRTLTLTLGVLLLAVLPSSAQVYYSCDFEDQAELNNWVWNKLPASANTDVKKAAFKNRWFVGATGHSGVSTGAGLYVSNDIENGSNNDYSRDVTNSLFIVSYRDNLTLPAAGTYQISFDWRAYGYTGAGAGADHLYVCWVPSSYTTALNSTNTLQAPAWMTNYQIADLSGSMTWRSFTTTFTTPTADGRLAFIWVAGPGTTPMPPAASVDNIEIMPAGCNAPTNVRYNSSGTLSWGGSAQYFDVRVYNSNYNVWTEYYNVSGNSLKLTDITEGYYTFMVRSVCDTTEATLSHSGWTSISQFAWMKGVRCIDFMDLDAATCYYGPFDTPTNLQKGSTVGKIDRGFSSIDSHHTLHYVLGETDPRTNNLLPTVPAGEVASVRLGNWRDDSSIQSQGAAEAIEYKYRVQAGQSDILVINYAVVMEKPGHNDGTDPHFLLEILDQRGNQIGGQNSSCYSADFAAASNRPQDLIGWTEWEPGSESGIEGARYSPIIWKPWTQVSVSLRNYVGQTLTIRFTTKDCRQSAHWAYAYFTMGCRSGELEGLSCGDFATDHFTAPEGFNYRWYKESDPNTTLETKQTLHIEPQDTSIYLVEVINKTGDNCSYTLTANPNPRFPHADFRVRGVNHRECQNIVAIENNSKIYYRNRLTSEIMDGYDTEDVEDVIWNWGDGTIEEHNANASIEHAFPAQGGTFHIVAVASMSNGVCVEMKDTTIDLPNLLNADEVTNIHRCMGEYVDIRGQRITNNYSDTTSGFNAYGCEALNITNVIFHDVSYDTTRMEICEGGYVDFEGKRYDVSGLFPAVYRSVYGCDSIHTLDLTILPRLAVETDTLVLVCGDDMAFDINYALLRGRTNGLTVRMPSELQACGFQPTYDFTVDPTYDLQQEATIPMPKLPKPGIYTLKLDFGSPDCPSDPVEVPVKIRYGASVIAQKYNLVALLNENYNGGGYRWQSYQWFRNGYEIQGATTSYLVVSEDDLGAEYYCLMMDEEGNLMETCPIVYNAGLTALDNLSVLAVAQTIYAPGEAIRLAAGGSVTIYDALGRAVSSVSTPASELCTIAAPSVPGVYLVSMKNGSIRILVR